MKVYIVTDETGFPDKVFYKQELAIKYCRSISTLAKDNPEETFEDVLPWEWGCSWNEYEIEEEEG